MGESHRPRWSAFVRISIADPTNAKLSLQHRFRAIVDHVALQTRTSLHPIE